MTRARLVGVLLGLCVGGCCAFEAFQLACDHLFGDGASLDSLYTPSSIDAVHPGAQGAVLAIGDSGFISVADPADRSLHRLAQSDELLNAMGGFIHAVWWSSSRSRVLMQVTTNDPTPRQTVWQWEIGTSPTELVELDASAWMPTPTCMLLDTADRLACVSQHEDNTGPTNVNVRTIELHSLTNDRSVERTVWTTPVAELGAVRVADASAVYFSDRCGAEPYGDHCLYRAALDGSARVLVGPIYGNVCEIAISRDGSHLALAAHDADYTSPCLRLWVADLAHGAAPRRIADVTRPADALPGSYDGITQLVFAPDGARLTFLSDEEDGCAGSEGISNCSRYLSTIAFDGSHRGRVGTYWVDGELVWMPPGT